MDEMLRMQKEEANQAFAKFVRRNYTDWIANPDKRPMMSHDLFRKRIFPLLDNGQKVFSRCCSTISATTSGAR